MFKIHYFLKYLKWILNGKPQVYYCGFHCGLCGSWVSEPFYVPTYLSGGREMDTVGICKKCKEL